MKNSNFPWLLLAAYCLFSLFFGFSLSLFIHRLPDVSQPLENTQRWIYADHPVSQIITPQNDGLNVITVYLKNVSLRNQDSFRFSLSDDSGTVRTINLTGYNIGDGDNVRFQFAPVVSSAGRPFRMTLTSDSPRALAIGAGWSDRAGSLAYQTYYYPLHRFQVLKTVATDFVRSAADIRLVLVATIAFAIAYLFAARYVQPRLD